MLSTVKLNSIYTHLRHKNRRFHKCGAAKIQIIDPPPAEFNLAIECSIPLGGIELMTFGHEVQDFSARPSWLKMIYEHIFVKVLSR